MVWFTLSATNRLPALSTATPSGQQNRAALPVPSSLPQSPARPARVVTTLPGVTFRIVPQSGTKTLPALSAATSVGPPNSTALPVPSLAPRAPAQPARVVTTPAEVTFRIVELSESATKTLPALSTATPDGLENRAAVPEPSALPQFPALPASVVTAPAEVTFRIVLLPESATKTLPTASTATPDGPLNCAELPVPSLMPGVPALPASVVTTPAEVTFRIVELPVSATKTLPALSTATPEGRLNRASLPVPSALPEFPALPASVVTIPAGVTSRI